MNYITIVYIFQIEDLLPYTAYDFGVYQSIYEIAPYQWYTPSTHYYYSPFFYVLFYAFHWLSFEVYLVIAVCVFLIGLFYCFQKLDWFLWLIMSLNIALSIWFLAYHGNVDLFLFTFLILLWFNGRNDKIGGFLFGLLTFKGIIVYVWPLFLWKAVNKRQFFWYTILGVILNYGWFVIDPIFPVWLGSFIGQIFTNDLVGPEYYLGGHYPWLWGILVLFVNEYLERMKKKSQSRN